MTPHVLQIGMLWGQAGAAGGLDRVYTDMVRMLPANGIEITGAVSGPDDVLSRSSGRVHSFAPQGASPVRRYWAARHLIRKLMRENEFDLVVSHFTLYAGLVLDQLNRQPFVVHFHGPWSKEGAEEGTGWLAAQIKYRIERAVYRRAGRVIVLSRAFGELITRDYNVPADRIRLIPGHVDLARFTPTPTRAAARARLGWPSDRPILLAVRRLVRRMGINRLVTAMSQVVVAVPDVLLCVGGRGPMEADLRKQVEEAGLTQHVWFLGFVPEEVLPLVYRGADLNVVPTNMLEGFGLTAAEALASGTPSMVTPVGGLPEVVAPLSPDLIFHSTSANDIAAGIIAVLRGGINLPPDAVCRAYAEAHFALPLAAARTAQVYRELLE